VFAVGKRSFTLRTRADRIERLAGGNYAILDYKTGQTPSEKQVRTGLSPQLTLEGAMLRAGAFEGIASATISEMAYVALRGGDPPGEARSIEFKEGTPDGHADRSLAMLKSILARFENVETPYRSLVSPMWKTRYGDYDHLARIKEWSAGPEEEE
jgi:ATP-dependent helicase/nuclease subunit B